MKPVYSGHPSGPNQRWPCNLYTVPVPFLLFITLVDMSWLRGVAGLEGGDPREVGVVLRRCREHHGGVGVVQRAGQLNSLRGTGGAKVI